MVGTGIYNSYSSVAYLKNYGTLVGAFIYNDGFPYTTYGVYVQATCARVSTSASSLSLSKQEQLRQFKADKAVAMAKSSLRPVH